MKTTLTIADVRYRRKVTKELDKFSEYSYPLHASQRQEVRSCSISNLGGGWRTVTDKPSISLHFNSERVKFKFDKEGKLVCPNIKVLKGKHLAYIKRKEERIRKLHQDIQDYLIDNTKELADLTLEQAEKCTKHSDSYWELKDKVIKQMKGKDKSVKKLGDDD